MIYFNKKFIIKFIKNLWKIVILKKKSLFFIKNLIHPLSLYFKENLLLSKKFT